MPRKEKSGLRRFWVIRHPFKTVGLLMLIPVIALYLFFAQMGEDLFENKACRYWHRNMTKEEKIKVAVKVANDKTVTQFEFTNPESGHTLRATGQSVPYDDPNTILRDNPDCCNLYSSYSVNIESNYHNYDFSEEIPPSDEGVVVLQYIGQHLENGKIEPSKVITFVTFDDCKPRFNFF